MYVIPAFQPGYSSYGPYLPVATFGVDGQYLGQQPFSPGPLFQPSIASPGYYPNALPYGELVPSPYPCDPSFLVGDATYGNNFNGLHEIPCSKSNVSSASHNHAPVSKKLPNSDFGHPPELKKSLPSLNVSTGHDMHQLKPRNKVLEFFILCIISSSSCTCDNFAMPYRLCNMVQLCSQMLQAEVTSHLQSFRCIIKGRLEGFIQIALLITNQMCGGGVEVKKRKQEAESIALVILVCLLSRNMFLGQQILKML